MILRHSAFILFFLGALGSADAASVSLSNAAGHYRLTPEGSKLLFTVAAVSGDGIAGRFQKFSGSIDIDSKDVTRSHVDITIFSDSVATGEARIDQFLRSDAVFNAASDPAISFKSVRVQLTGTDTATIEGQLTARGRTYPQIFYVRLLGLKGTQISFHVEGKVMRSRYGMDVGTPIYSNIVDFNMDLSGRRR